MEVVELRPELHMIAFPIGHAYLWRGSDALTLIDSGLPGSAPLIAAAVEALGYQRGQVRRLLLTHWHGDHVGSAAEIATWGEVGVYAHQADAPVIRGQQPGAPPILADWERPIFERVGTQLPDQKAQPVDVDHDHELADGDIIDLGGTSATALAVPGHTAGSVAFYLPAERVLFAGDTIARGPDGRVLLGVFNADPPQAAASFRRQAALEVDIACFGHGEPLTRNTTAALRAAAGLT